MRRHYLIIAGLTAVIAVFVAACWWMGTPQPAGSRERSTQGTTEQPGPSTSVRIPDRPLVPAPKAPGKAKLILVDGPGDKAKRNPQPRPAPVVNPDPYKDAEVIAEETTEDKATGKKIRTRIVKTKKQRKYPLVRVEEVETKTPDGGRAVSSRKEMVADHIIVKLRPGTKEEALVSLNAKLDAKIRRKMRVPDTYLIEIPAKTAQALPRMVALYRREARTVAYAEPDYIVRTTEDEVVPNDPDFGQLWGLKNTGQNGGTADADIGAPVAWTVGTGSRSVKVAVIDTGVDYTHPDLADNIWTNAGEIAGDGIDNDGNGFVDDVHGWDFFADTNDPMDDHFHGTHCAGTIGAVGDNGIGVTGVCWQVSIIPLKFLDSTGAGWTSDAVEAIAYATALNVDVMSNSWGGGAYSQTLYDAIDAANDAGILFVAAAGNDNMDNDAYEQYPASYTIANVITVAATDSRDAIASFSNHGAMSVELGAPGVDIYSTFPTSQTAAMASRGYAVDYGTLDGTSMATPHVAGAAALLKASDPILSCSQIRERLLTSTDRIPGLTGKCLSEGRLDVGRALLNQTEPLLIAAITHPVQEGYCSKDVEIRGTADSSDFTHYTIQVGRGYYPTSWTTSGVVLANGGTQPVVDGKLGDWHYTSAVSEVWTIRLRVYVGSGSKMCERWVCPDPYLKPGFPAYTMCGNSSRSNNYCTVVADLDGDGKKEVIGTTGAGPLYAFDYRGQVLPGWPVGTYQSFAAASDMDGDGKAEVGQACRNQYNSWGLVDWRGTYLSGWPKSILNYAGGAPTIADVDGDGQEDILLNQKAHDVSIFRMDGTVLPGWPQLSSSSELIRSPVVADVDGDGAHEVLAIDDEPYSPYKLQMWRADGSIVPGWPKFVGFGGNSADLALGDVDGDGAIEIVAVFGDQIHVLSVSGMKKPGWPVTLPDAWTRSPALADLDGDGSPEIVVPSRGLLHVYRGDGSLFPGWPQASPDYEDPGNFAPVVGDIDGDGQPDIVMGWYHTGSIYTPRDAALLAWHADGTLVSGFPMYRPLRYGSVPAIADIDDDGRNDLIVFANPNPVWPGMVASVFAWDFNAAGAKSGGIEWGQLRGGSGHTGLYWRNQRDNLRPVAMDQDLQTLPGQALQIVLVGKDDHNAPLTYTLVSTSSHGTITGEVPNLTYTPEAGYQGSDLLTFKVNDGVWDSTVANVSIMVNSRPTAADISIATDEDNVVIVTLSGSDPDGHALTYHPAPFSSEGYPKHGHLSGTGASITYRPYANYNGPDSFTYTVNDGLQDSNVATVSLTIVSVNDVPVAQDRNVVTAVDMPKDISLQVYDVENSPLSYTLVTEPQHGVLEGEMPAVRYVPNPAYVGNDDFTFVANDGEDDSNIATVSIKVSASPIAEDLAISTDEDTPIDFTFPVTDANNDYLLYYLVTAPSHGTISGNGATRTYTPDANYHGPDSFTYKAYDYLEYSNVATVTINVASVDDPPIAVQDTAWTMADQPVTIPNVLGNDSEADGEPITLASFTQPQHGAVTAEPDNAFLYTPETDFYGRDEFTYTITDPQGNTAVGLVVIAVLGPESEVGSWPTMGNGPARTGHVPLTLSSDPLEEDWSVILGTQPLRQVAIGAGRIYAVCSYTSGNVAVSLDANTGIELWRYPIGSGYYTSPPTFANGKVFVAGRYYSWLYAIDAVAGTAQWTTPYNADSHVYLAPLVANATVYLPGGTYGGMYAFDEQTGTQRFWKSLQRSYSPWAPSMAGNRLFACVGLLREFDPDTGNELWNLSLDSYSPVPVVSEEMAWVAGQKLRAIDLSTQAVIWSVDGPYSHSPAVADGVVYAIRDTAVDAFSAATGRAVCTYQTDTEPIWQPIVTQNTLFIASTTKTYVFNLHDGTLRQTLPYGGRLSLAGTRLYIATDSGELRTYTMTEVVVPPDNVLPVAEDMNVTTDEETPVTISLQASDANGDVLSYLIQDYPEHGTLSTAGAERTYTPDPEYHGQDSFTYKAYDGYPNGYGNVATVTIQVAPVNDVPVAMQDQAATAFGESVIVTNVLSNDEDVDGDALTVVSFTQPANGTVSQEPDNSFLYVPAVGFYGADEFTYTISDPHGATAMATVFIVVLGSDVQIGTWPTMGNGPEHMSSVPLTVSQDLLVEDWSATLGTRPLHQVAIGQGRVFVVEDTSNHEEASVVTMDANTGIELWRTSLGDTRYISPPTYANGRVFAQQYASSDDGKAHSIDAITGTVQWTSSYGEVTYAGSFGEFYAPLVANSTVYMGFGGHSKMYAFDEATGAQNFFVTVARCDGWTPAMAGDRLFAWVGGSSACDFFREFDPVTGELLWSVSFAHSFYTSSTMNTVPAVCSDTAWIIEGDAGGSLRAIDLATHAEKWYAPGPYRHSPAVAGNVVYAIRDTYIDAFTADTGQPVRTYEADTALIWQPIVTENTLFVASAAKTYVFNLSDGVLRQTLPYGGRLSLAGTRLYIATDAGELRTYTMTEASALPVIDSAWADPNPVTGTTTTVSVIAGDDNQPPLPLTYFWSKVSGPGSVTFSTPDADTSTATFSQAGSYVLSVGVSSDAGSVASEVLVEVLQTPTSLSLLPTICMVSSGSTQAFSASVVDQFGDAILDPDVSWSASGGGTIDSEGLFTATQEGGPFTVTATIAGLSATASVTVIDGTLGNGLIAEFFDFNSGLSTIPALTGRAPDVGRIDLQVNYPSTSGTWTGLDSRFAETFATRHTGYLRVDEPGSYTLYINSDDGSKLWLDGSLAINNDGLHGMREYAATLELDAGYHPLRIEFFENGGGAGLIFSWAGPGIGKQVVPPSALYHAGPVNWPPVANAQSVTTDEDTALAITLTGSDPDGDPLTYQVISAPANGTLSGTAPNLTYTPAQNFTGDDSFTFKVNDGEADSAPATVSITVRAVSVSPKLAHGTIAGIGDSWQTVTLPHTYDSMIVVATPLYGSGSAPLVARVRNASGNSFELKVQNPGSGSTVTPCTVHYIAVEEGVYSVAGHGVNMEAVKYVSSVTDRKGSYVGETRTYQNAYTSPVVLGQVMTANDARFSVFWSMGSSRTTPPSATVLKTGKTVCEDSVTTRSDETVGYIVIESGTAEIEGIRISTAVGADTVQGYSDAPPYSYTAGGITGIQTVVLSSAALDGGDCGWPILYGAPIGNTIKLAFDEDQIGDSERNHTTEQVAYLAIEGDGNRPPVANGQSVTTSQDTPKAITLTGSDPDGDPLTYTVVSDPANGTLSGTVPNPTYTPNAGFTGSDSFTFKVNDGTDDSNVATVSITVTSTAGPPVAGYSRWFDASQITGVADGGAVSTWEDRSGNHAHAVVPSGNAAPVYVANAGTGTSLGALYFARNGGANNSAALRFTRDSNIRTVFSVFKGSSFLLTDAGSYHFHRPGDTNPADPLWISKWASANIKNGATYVNGTQVDGTTAPMPTSLHNGFNLVEVVTAGPVTADSFNKDRTYHAGNQYHAEVIIYDRVLTEAERLSVADYLNTKWFGATANTAPVSTDSAAITVQDEAVAVLLTATDVDGDPLTYTVVNGPTNGTLSGAAPNLTYTPNASFTGSDSFTFKANDGTDDSNIATVSITVNEVAAYQPGLWFGQVSGNINTTTPNPNTQRLVNVASKTEDGIGGNTTEIYTGEIYDADGHISFTESIDDKARIWIDGQLVLSDNSWNNRTSTGDLALAPGWHSIEIRISNGNGGSGPYQSPGIGFDPSGGANWQTLADPGDGSMLRSNGN